MNDFDKFNFFYSLSTLPPEFSSMTKLLGVLEYDMELALDACAFSFRIGFTIVELPLEL